jgi:hypothetical protein
MYDHVSLKVRNFTRSLAFYAAFVFDPDGNNLEAVTQSPK